MCGKFGAKIWKITKKGAKISKNQLFWAQIWIKSGICYEPKSGHFAHCAIAIAERDFFAQTCLEKDGPSDHNGTNRSKRNDQARFWHHPLRSQKLLVFSFNHWNGKWISCRPGTCLTHFQVQNESRYVSTWPACGYLLKLVSTLCKGPKWN